MCTKANNNKKTLCVQRAEGSPTPKSRPGFYFVI